MARDLLASILMTARQEAQPKPEDHETPAPDEAREHEEDVEKNSVAPVLPTSKNQGPRRSGAV